MLDTSNLLNEEILTTLEFNVEIPITFVIDSHEHEEGRRKEGRYGQFESQDSISDYALMKLFETFKLMIAKLIFTNEIKDREPFIIDSENYGLGVAVAPFSKNTTKWYLHLITVVKYNSLNKKFRARQNQLVIMDGGKYRRG